MADYRFYLDRVLTKKMAQPTGIRPNYIYGLLYNWYAAADSRIANSGFTVPTDAEWTAMTDYVNTTYNVAPNDFGVGNHLKSCRQVNSPLGGECATIIHPRWNSNATQFGRDTLKFGLSAGGLRRININFSNGGGIQGGYLSKDGNGRYLLNSNNTITTFNYPNGDGLSIRLQRHATPSELLIPEGQIISNYYKGNNNFLYDCVRINDRIWTVQNLAETKWSDGTLIPFAGANGINFTNAEWAALTTPGVCAYNNDTETWAYTLP